MKLDKEEVLILEKFENRELKSVPNVETLIKEFQNLKIIMWKDGTTFIAKMIGLEIIAYGNSKEETLTNLEIAFTNYLDK
jgi:hypothetical protein